MSVLPPASSHAIPKCLRKLMLNEDSDIIDFYPADFLIDVRGKRYAWLGEVILPFVEEDRVLRAI